MKKMILRFYSATGNSEYIAHQISDTAILNGWSVDCRSIEEENSDHLAVNGEQLVLVYPVLGFAPVSFMIDFVKRIPAGRGAVYLVTACGAVMGKKGVGKGYPGGSFAHLEPLLRKKGFTISGTAAISLPDNFTQLLNPPSPNECEIIFREMAPEIQSLCEDIVAEKSFTFPMAQWVRTIFVLGSPLFLSLGRIGLMHIFIADKNCNGCGLCEKRCPAKTIKMVHKYPVWTSGCSGCGRCINICPQRSIQTSPIRLVSSLALVFAIQLAGIWLGAGFLTSQGVGMSASWAISIVLIILLTVPINQLYIAIAQPLLSILERVPLIRTINSMSYTKRYYRYHAHKVKASTIKKDYK